MIVYLSWLPHYIRGKAKLPFSLDRDRFARLSWTAKFKDAASEAFRSSRVWAISFLPSLFPALLTKQVDETLY